MHILPSSLLWLGAALLLGGAGWFLLSQNNGPTVSTTTAEIGTVTAFVSVSGSAQIDDIIPLSFPSGGTVSGIMVSRGDTVATGTVLATVGDTALQAEYAAAAAEVQRVRAVRDELIRGQTDDETQVTAATTRNAETALSNTIRTEAARVEAARTTLYSSGLSAISTNPDTVAPPPTVSGSYTCTAPGTYTITPYRSGTLSDFSYRYTGIETGVGTVSTNQTTALGTCGLRLQFTSNANYTNTEFTISIPNQTSTNYATNRALYEQALAQEEANIIAARRALDLALNQSTLTTAGARVEKIIAANAVVAAAEARLTQASYTLNESAIRAPQSGTVTDIQTVAGETVGINPVITLFAPRQTTVTARIPEKDIARIEINQTVTMQFDANLNESLSGNITFISPLQTVVNGVPYYEAIITLTETPTWLRSGMQADLRIVTEQLTDAVRIPRLFLQNGSVTIRNGDTIATTTPVVVLLGTDGFVAVEGINAGETLQLQE